MLDSLFSNQNIERILLFLFVNEKGYGSQIKNLLEIPLTPIQQALTKLEHGEVIISHFEKNKRIYSLNTKHPLYSELEQLIKKAYMLLPASEKKKYCVFNDSKNSDKKETAFKKAQLKRFFKRLSNIGTLKIHVQSKKGPSTETKEGQALVVVQATSENELTFYEKGSWNLGIAPSLSFNNSFRWTFDYEKGSIFLEHLRYGEKNPILLFELSPSHHGVLESLEPHLCNQDTYLGNVNWNKEEILLNIRIIGPNKNDSLNYCYQ